MDLFEVLAVLGVFRDGHKCGHAGGPRGGAHLSGALVCLLESLYQPQGLRRAAAHRQVVHTDVANNALGIDDVGGPEGHTGVGSGGDEAAVALGDGVTHVGDEGDVHLADTARFALLLAELHVGELRVARAREDLTAVLPEFLAFVSELDDLGRAHEREVHRVKEQHHVLA